MFVSLLTNRRFGDAPSLLSTFLNIHAVGFRAQPRMDVAANLFVTWGDTGPTGAEGTTPGDVSGGALPEGCAS